MKAKTLWFLLLPSLLSLAVPVHAQATTETDWGQQWATPGGTAFMGDSTVGTGSWIWRLFTDKNLSVTTERYTIAGMAHDGQSLYVNYRGYESFVDGKLHVYGAIERRQPGGLGEVIWRHEATRFFTGNPLIIDGELYISYNAYRATGPGDPIPPESKGKAGILVLDATTGNVLRDHRLGVDAIAPLTSATGLLIAVADWHNIIALKIQDGSQAWIWSTPAYIWSPPAIGGNTAVVASSEGLLVGLDLQRGLARWTYKVNGSLLTNPVIHGDLVFVHDLQGVLTALFLGPGLPAWTQDAGGTWGARIAVREGLLVSQSATLEPGQFRGQTSLHGWDPLTGKHLWSWKGPVEASLSGGIVLTDNTIFFVQTRILPEPEYGDRKLIALDIASREIVWEAYTWGTTGTEAESIGPIMANGRLYVGGGLFLEAVDTGAEPTLPPQAAMELSAAQGYQQADWDLEFQDRSTAGTRPIVKGKWYLVDSDFFASHPDWENNPSHRSYLAVLFWQQKPDPYALVPLSQVPPGKYTVVLEIEDDQGRIGIASHPFEVLPGEAPQSWSTSQEAGSIGLACLALALLGATLRRGR